MDRRDSEILLSDAVDQNGVAVLADATMPLNEDSKIAPWIDLPPTPPPKSAQHSKSFGFSQKASFVSLVSLRHSSTTSLPRNNHAGNLRSSESQASLYHPESTKRRSTDDNESYTGLVYSGSSSHSGNGASGDLRRQKSSLFSRLRSRPSKPKLREDGDESERQLLHPSLRPPVPPLPDQRPLLGLGVGLGLGGSTSTVALSLPLPGAGKKDKREKISKKKTKDGHGKVLPTPPPKDGEGDSTGQEYTGDLNLNSMDGILNYTVLSAGLGTTASAGSQSNGSVSALGSPSTGFVSQSYSDHEGGGSAGSTTFRFNQHPFVPASEFSDPFSTSNASGSASSQQHEKGRHVKDYRKVSPTSIPIPPLPPQPQAQAQPPPSSSSHNDISHPLPLAHHPHPHSQPLQQTTASLPHSLSLSPPPTPTPTSGPGSPTWVPPESWAVEKGSEEDLYNYNAHALELPDGAEALDSGSETSVDGEGEGVEGGVGAGNGVGKGIGSESSGGSGSGARSGYKLKRGKREKDKDKEKGKEKKKEKEKKKKKAEREKEKGQAQIQMLALGRAEEEEDNDDDDDGGGRGRVRDGDGDGDGRDVRSVSASASMTTLRYPYPYPNSNAHQHQHLHPSPPNPNPNPNPNSNSTSNSTSNTSNSSSRKHRNPGGASFSSLTSSLTSSSTSLPSITSTSTSISTPHSHPTSNSLTSRPSTATSLSLSLSASSTLTLSGRPTPRGSLASLYPNHPNHPHNGHHSHSHPHPHSNHHHPMYKMRVYRSANMYNVVSIDLETTVADLIVRLNHKILKEMEKEREKEREREREKEGQGQGGDREKAGEEGGRRGMGGQERGQQGPQLLLQHNLYLKEQGRERMLSPHERPAAIVKLRMEQAGYDPDDGQHLLGSEGLNILLKFFFKSQLLAGEEQIAQEKYEHVDLTSRGLRTIPVILHQNADSIISLKLDRNPMIEIPLDFIQSCTTLRDLKLQNMSMKKVPQSLRHSTTLHRLSLSSNSIRDLDEAYLDHIPSLMGLYLENNRLEKMPWYFPRLRSLTTLNISNNKFRVFPAVVTQLESLQDLDVSFNMLHELPEDIGKLRVLDRFVLVGNHITKFPEEVVGLVALRTLDCRRNQIADLGLVCMLPALTTLSADWNNVHVVDLSLGDRLRVLQLSHNDVTQLSLVPGPMGRPPYGLTLLDLSYAKLSTLDDIALSQLSSLWTLRLDHNSIRSIPDSLGELKWLETLSCTDNKLDALPRTIGKLGRLRVLDAHNNSLTELPGELWECGSLEKVNVTSNFISVWADPPVPVGVGAAGGGAAASVNGAGLESPMSVDGHLTVPGVDGMMMAAARKQSLSSTSIKDSNFKDTKENLPPLARSLQKLYIGENCLSGDGVLRPLMIFVELRVLNLSFNEIQDLPPSFFRNMTHLEEIYLSGNKLTSIPAEDFPRLTRLRTLYLNGNKLHTLPQELAKVASLMVLDVGSNFLKYNINNWEFDWNWNFNTNLRYLNLSGNKRLQIKADSTSQRISRQPNNTSAHMLSGFTSLSQLRVLGLMDVTITTTAKDATVDIPDENADRRVRTSLSTVCGMSYGIADSLGKNEYLTMIDLVHEFHGRNDEAIFAMFGRTQPHKSLNPGASPNPFSKFLHDNFVNVFKTQLGFVNEKVDRDGMPLFPKKENIRKALHWTFLKLNQEIWENLVITRKNSQMGMRQTYHESQYYRMGVSGIALYFSEKTIYAANVGDALAVVSRQGVCHEISRKHDPYDRLETARIRAAEGFISATGLVNEEVDVSRSFGYYYLFPPINARPDIFVYDLTEMDEFVIIANRGLWDYVPYQTAVDIARTVARTERPDPMLAAEKLRDFAISYGADGSTMIMVIWVADLFHSPAARSRQPTLESLIDPQLYKAAKKKGEIRDRLLDRLDGEVPPPTGHVTIVFTDIRNSTHLWEANPGMPTAMRLHNSLLRRQLRFCGGYEVKTEGDSFMCSFPTTLAAVWWCLTVQVQLLHESWPLEILECEDGKPIYDAEGRLIARGLSVRMGIHSGNPLCETDLITHRMDYFGPMVNRSARINGSAQGGQIMCSMDIVREINARVFETEEETEYSKLQNPAAVETIKRLGVVIKPVGEVKLKGIELPEILSVLYPRGLEGRHELKESPADPSASSGSPFRLNVAQVKELGVLTLRVEATSSGRVFKPLPGRKASIQSNPETEPSAAVSKAFYGDPNVLLPSINDSSSEADLLLVLDSLATRLENALDAIGNRYHVPLSPAVDFLMTTLMRDGALDRETLDYIASILGR